jgi:hypothetical protein
MSTDKKTLTQRCAEVGLMAGFGALLGVGVYGLGALTVAEWKRGPGAGDSTEQLEAATERHRQATKLLEELESRGGVGGVTEVRLCSGSDCKEFRRVELD